MTLLLLLKLEQKLEGSHTHLTKQRKDCVHNTQKQREKSLLENQCMQRETGKLHPQAFRDHSYTCGNLHETVNSQIKCVMHDL